MTQWGLDVLFNPAKRHMDEAKLREQTTREEAGDSSGGRRIDLESGKVVITRKKAASDELTEDEDEATDEDVEEPPDAADDPAVGDAADEATDPDGATDEDGSAQK